MRPLGFVSIVVLFVGCASSTAAPSVAPVATPTASASSPVVAPPAPALATRATVRLTSYGSAVEPGSLHVERVHDHLTSIADACRTQHAVVAGAHATLAFERKGALMSAVVGVTIAESAQLSDDAIACLRDGVLAAHLDAEAGTFDGALVRFE